jgi:hypothetical protein
MPGETIDYNTLVTRLAVNLDDVEACLVMSRDGLTLGVSPREGEEVARRAWDRLQSIGDPERGFLFVGDKLWILTRRGPYVGVVVAGASATPGLLLDRLDSMLRSAEELRVRDDAPQPGSRSEAARRPRTPLHREPEPAPERPEPAAEEPEPTLVPVPTVDISEPLARSETPPTDPIKAALQFASIQRGDAPSDPTPEGNGSAPGPPDHGPQAADSEALSFEPVPVREPMEEVAKEPAPGDAPAAPEAPEDELMPLLKLQPEPELEPELELRPEHEPEPELDDMPEPDDTLEPEAETAGEPEAEPVPEPPRRRDDAEVDHVALAREFSLLMDDGEY